MGTRTLKQPLRIVQLFKSFTNISGNAEANITLTSDLPTLIGVPSSGTIFNFMLASDAGFNGAIFDVFKNGNSLYLKANKALNNATLNMYFYYYI